MEVVGSVRIGGNPPCLFCGYGESCDYSNVAVMYGKGACIHKEMIYSFDTDEESKRQALLIGERLGQRLKDKGYDEVPSSCASSSFGSCFGIGEFCGTAAQAEAATA